MAYLCIIKFNGQNVNISDKGPNIPHILHSTFKRCSQIDREREREKKILIIQPNTIETVFNIYTEFKIYLYSA